MTLEIIFSSYFHFKAFPEREREREREPRSQREKKKRLRRRTSSSSLTTTDRAPVRQSHRADRRSQHRADRTALLNLAFNLDSVMRSQFDRIWWIFLLGFVSFVNECGIDILSACLQLRKCMENWVAWLCKAFSVKIFERTKHRNWFSVKRILRQPNSLNTFFFPENSISEKYLFSRKYFTGTKHNLSLAIETIYDGSSLQSFITFVSSSRDDTELRWFILLLVFYY